MLYIRLMFTQILKFELIRNSHANYGCEHTLRICVGIIMDYLAQLGTITVQLAFHTNIIMEPDYQN